MAKKFIAHYGIPKMKWGVRRYENYDGTLTTAGKARYRQEVKIGRDAAKALKEASNIGKDPQKSKKVNKQDYSKISDQELRARVNRLNMERQYGELTGDTKRVRSGGDWVRETLQTVGTVASIGLTAATLYMTFKDKTGLAP